MSERTKDLTLTLLTLVLAAAMLLPNLGGQCLWQDEAQTALIAGTVLQHGVPLGHDGTNSFSQDEGKDYGKNYVWLWHPWLPFYVLAGFFAAFGKSTLVCRLPFALFGIGTVVLAYRFGQSFWKSKLAGLFAAVALAANVSFMILARQCRYYAPGMFFALLGLYAYHAMIERRKYAAVVFAVSAILLFHTHYVHYAALLLSVGTHALLFHRDRIKPVLIASVVTAVVNAPWIFWFAAMGRIVETYADPAARAFYFVQVYRLHVGRYVFPPVLLLAPFVVWAMNCRSRNRRVIMDAEMWKRMALLLIFGVVNLATIVFSSTRPFFRFIAPLIPVACLAIGLILDSVTRLHRGIGPVLAVGILVSMSWSWRMPDYLYELTHKYVGPVDGIVAYLRSNARGGDVVATNYDDLPIKFYTGLRVIGGLTGEDLKPAVNAEWVIVRQYTVGSADDVVKKFLRSHVIPQNNYQSITLDAPDFAFQNREEPDLHQFRTVAREKPVVILRRISSKAEGL